MGGTVSLLWLIERLTYTTGGEVGIEVPRTLRFRRWLYDSTFSGTYCAIYTSLCYYFTRYAFSDYNLIWTYSGKVCFLTISGFYAQFFKSKSVVSDYYSSWVTRFSINVASSFSLGNWGVSNGLAFVGGLKSTWCKWREGVIFSSFLVDVL